MLYLSPIRNDPRPNKDCMGKINQVSASEAVCKAAPTASCLTLIVPMSTSRSMSISRSMSTSRSIFHGRGRKLVLAFDVGTTYSGISYRCANLQTQFGRHSLIHNWYSVLDPGVIPEIKGVTRWIETALSTLIVWFNATFVGFRHMNISVEPRRYLLSSTTIVPGTSRL